MIEIVIIIFCLQDTSKLFTGLAAKKMVNEHYCQSQLINSKQWRVFLLGDFADKMLKKDTMVLYPLCAVSVSTMHVSKANLPVATWHLF